MAPTRSSRRPNINSFDTNTSGRSITKRRNFLTAAARVASSSAFPGFAIGKPGKSANSKLNVAFIGSGGWIAKQPYNQGCSGGNLVAFCDVDRNLSSENMKNWRTSQPFFEDFRVMFDKVHKEIDAVVIATPDRTSITPPNLPGSFC